MSTITISRTGQRLVTITGDGLEVAVNPANVTHVVRYKDDNSVEIHLVGGGLVVIGRSHGLVTDDAYSQLLEGLGG